MPDISTKEVRFDEWCPKCKHWGINEYEEPCNSCLNEPCNEHSTKPLMWQEAEK